MRPPATCAEGANLNDNKVKPLAAGSVCFPVPARGALACAPHSRCFGNLKLSIRHGLCRGPMAEQREMLSLAVTNDRQRWFWGRKSSFQICPILAGLEMQEPVALQARRCQWMGQGLGAPSEPCGWEDLAWCWLCHSHSWYYGASSCRAALPWPSWSSLVTGSFPYGLGCSMSGWSCSTPLSSSHCASHTWPEGVMDSFLWALIVSLN